MKATLGAVATLLVATPVVASGCAPRPWTFVDLPKNELCTGERGARGVLAELHSGNCYGACAVYRVTLCGDGTVVYDGMFLVKKPGRSIRQLSPSALAELSRSLDRLPDGPSPLEDSVGGDAEPPQVMHMQNARRRWLPITSPQGEPTDTLFLRATGVESWVGMDQNERRRWWAER